MRVIATTGMPGAGKNLAVEVAEELSIPVVRMGDMVRQAAKDQGLPDEPASYAKVASQLREQHGPGAWAEPTTEAIEQRSDEIVLVDGLRNFDEVQVFREELGDVLIVAILAAPDTRYERMLKRGRGEDADTVDELRERDHRELGYGLGDVIAMADIYIENEGDPAETTATLRAILGTQG